MKTDIDRRGLLKVLEFVCFGCKLYFYVDIFIDLFYDISKLACVAVCMCVSCSFLPSLLFSLSFCIACQFSFEKFSVLLEQ